MACPVIDAPTREPFTTECCECHEPLDVRWQPALKAKHAGFFLLTCFNEACAMHAYTLSDTHYPPEDLDKYLRGGRRG